MCGIAGFITINNFTGHEIKTIINNMSSTLSHRGPDNTGYWICESGQVALGHKRLSILDLSTSGHQPMISSSNRFIIVFNGEIYNHLRLRQEIDVYKNSKNIVYHSSVYYYCTDIHATQTNITPFAPQAREYLTNQIRYGNRMMASLAFGFGVVQSGFELIDLIE